MRLQQIVEILDAELDRLSRLREIVAGLTGSLVVLSEPEDTVAEMRIAASQEKAEAPRPEPKQRRVRRAPAVKRAVAEKETRALSASIPKAPVVVSAAVVQKEHAAKVLGHAARKQAETRPEPGSLGSMIRALQRETAL